MAGVHGIDEFWCDVNIYIFFIFHLVCVLFGISYIPL